MIDLKLHKLVADQAPVMNTQITEGLSTLQSFSVENYIHHVWKCAAETFPPGLKYLYGSRCTPYEEFKVVTEPTNPIKIFEMGKSDIYLMKYVFSFNGVELKPRYIFLPFLRPGNLWFARDARYMLTPVISGKVFNIENGNIYMPLQKFKMGFFKTPTACMLNEKVIQGSSVCSHLFIIKKPAMRSNLQPTLMHYILAEYGLSATLKLLFNVDAKIGKNELKTLMGKGHTVFSSIRRPPIRKTLNFELSDIHIAIPDNQYKSYLDNVMSTIFYIIDNTVESTSSVKDLENPQLWLRLLDLFIFKEQGSERKIFDRMEAHTLWAKHLMDPVTQKTLIQNNINCKTIFELFKYICINYEDIIIHNDPGSMYDKDLDAIKHFLYSVVYNIFTTTYQLQNIAPSMLNADKITKTFTKFLKKDRILSVKGHGELQSVSVATDAMIFSTTCNCINYSKANNENKGKRGGYVEIGSNLHPSQAEVGTYQWITQSEFTGRGKLSPFLKLANKRFIKQSEKLSDDINEFYKLLKEV